MEVQAQTQESSTTGKATSYPFSFTGSGKEFFGIWIVNLLLTIVTIGLYTPWAKVKTQRYFYGHTHLDNNTFQYLADPWKIFKGRLIAIAVFIFTAILMQFLPIIGPIVVFLGFIIIMPWLVNSSLRFNAVNSAYRNIRFDFKGDYWGAFMVFIIWPIIAMFTLYLLSPFWLQRLQKYIIGNSSYGQTPFNFDAQVSDYYAFFGKVFLMYLAVLAVIFGLSYFGASPVSMVITVPAFILIQAYATVTMANIAYSNSTLRANRFDSTMKTLPYSGIVLKNIVFIILTLGLYYPWAKVNLANYRAESLTLEATDLEDFVAGEKAKVSALGDELGEAFDLEIPVI